MTVYLLAVGGAAVAAACGLLPAGRLTGYRLLLLPLIVLGQLAVLGVLTRGVGPAYVPLIVVAFIYLGLACPPGASWLLLGPAVATWLLANDANEVGLPAATLIRLPIMMVVWLLVGELLARRTRSLEAQTDLLASQVTVDNLTGLANRRALPQLLAAARPGDALVMLDLDHFGRVNESRGHAGGDRVLADFGTAVKVSLRGQDRAVRYGGEEVLLLLPGVGGDLDPTGAAQAVDAALHRLRETWSRLQPDVTFSAGGAILSLGQSPAVGVQVADRALYEVKHAGRNGWRVVPADKQGVP
jgi:diguanylate cyclase (GGDEF)-like protein